MGGQKKRLEQGRLSRYGDRPTVRAVANWGIVVCRFSGRFSASAEFMSSCKWRCPSKVVLLGGSKANPRRSFLIGVACLTGAAAVANATTVQRTDTATLVSMAKLVVHGTVIGNEVVYDDGPNGPANVPTITTIQVTESFKGDAGETVTVAGFGGQSIGFLTQGRGAPRPSLEGVWYSRENFRSSRSLSTVNIFQ